MYLLEAACCPLSNCLHSHSQLLFFFRVRFSDILSALLLPCQPLASLPPRTSRTSFEGIPLKPFSQNPTVGSEGPSTGIEGIARHFRLPVLNFSSILAPFQGLIVPLIQTLKTLGIVYRLAHLSHGLSVRRGGIDSGKSEGNQKAKVHINNSSTESTKEKAFKLLLSHLPRSRLSIHYCIESWAHGVVPSCEPAHQTIIHAPGLIGRTSSPRQERNLLRLCPGCDTLSRGSLFWPLGASRGLQSKSAPISNKDA